MSKFNIMCHYCVCPMGLTDLSQFRWIRTIVAFYLDTDNLKVIFNIFTSFFSGDVLLKVVVLSSFHVESQIRKVLQVIMNEPIKSSLFLFSSQGVVLGPAGSISPKTL